MIRTYADQLTPAETAQMMQTSLDEAKQADAQHTDITKCKLSA